MNRRRAWAATRQAPSTGLRMLGSRDDPWSVWARATLIMSQGDYAGAARLLTPLAATPSEEEVAGLAAARLASGLRQIDAHDQAVAWDERAMRCGGQAAVDGTVGRAADAVGASDAETAQKYLGSVTRGPLELRDRIRVAWVACEIELLRGSQSAAEQAAEEAHRLSIALRSPRHEVKSTLFWAATQRHSHPDRSVRLLRSGFERAQALALRPMTWPIVIVLGDEASDDQVAAAGAAATFISHHLPPAAGMTWLERPDVTRLIAAASGDRPA